MNDEILTATFGLNAVNRLAEAVDAGETGALAALETFYYAFNNKDINTLGSVWSNSALAQLCNPLGGILRGRQKIQMLYEKIFLGPHKVWVELYDIVQYQTDATAVFAGRERGEFISSWSTLSLAIRTTRVFNYLQSQGGWRLVHPHGSIDDPILLAKYKDAVMAER